MQIMAACDGVGQGGSGGAGGRGAQGRPEEVSSKVVCFWSRTRRFRPFLLAVLPRFGLGIRDEV